MLSREQQDLVYESLAARYNKQELDAGLKKVAKAFIMKNMAFLEKRISMKEIQRVLQKKHNKNDAIFISIIPFLSKEIFFKFREYLPKDTRTVMDNLVWNTNLHQTQIHKLFNVDIIAIEEKEVRHAYYTKPKAVVRKEFALFIQTDHDGWYTKKPEGNFSLSLAYGLRRILIDYYEKPESAYIKPAKRVLECDHSYATGEIDVTLEMTRLALYMGQGEIKLTAKGRPAITTLAKAQRKINIKEFFPAKSEKGLRNLRTALLLGLLTSGTPPKIHRTENLIRFLFDEFYNKDYESGACVLYFIKGMTGVAIYDQVLVEPAIYGVLKELPLGEWVHIDNIISHATYNLVPLSAINTSFAAQKLYYSYKEKAQENGYSYTKDRHPLDNARYREGIELPYLKGSFFLFAAFGLVDIRYDEPDAKTLGKTYNSPYDGLRYVRLTKLGAYVLRQSNTYETPESGLKSSLILSKDNLMIVAKEEDETAAALLSPFTERVGTNRYRTDYNIFLKDCKSKNELVSKVTLFKQTVGNEIPENWVSFLKELESKIDPFEIVEEITVFKIAEKDKSLIQTIARDEVLKKLIIKAEGFHILVKKGNMAKFKKRLQEFGYLLT